MAEKYTGFITTSCGKDFLAYMVDFKDEKGRSMTKCICRARPEFVKRWVELGILRQSDILRDGTFIRIFPKYSLIKLGQSLGVQRFLTTVNFDGSDAEIGELSNKAKDQIILRLEEQVKFWEGSYYGIYEDYWKMMTQKEEFWKQQMGALKPIKDFAKPPFSPWAYQQLRGYRPMRMPAPTMISEEEEEM